MRQYRKGINHYGDEFIGFLNGWRGVLDNNFIPLTLENIDGIQLKGGTILHSSRTNVKKIPGGIEKVQEVLKVNKIDALIALGGDDTQSVTLFLSENGVNARRRSQDHRQRYQRHRPDLRLRHRRHDRHRGRRPHPHHGRLAQPRHRR